MAHRNVNTGVVTLTYSVRLMVKEDLEQVNVIDREAFPTQWPPANYRQELQNRIANYLVLCDDTRKFESGTDKTSRKKFDIIAWLMPWTRNRRQTVSIPPSPSQYICGFSGIWMMVDEAHITNIAVRQEYQGKGLGEFLLIATIDLAVELKASFLTLEVRASNLVAQRLYTKYGFIQMGIRRGYYLDNKEDAIIMSTESISAETFKAHLKELRKALKERIVPSVEGKTA
jgi:ribosomal-protein-alanine N-acetyltransferase